MRRVLIFILAIGAIGLVSLLLVRAPLSTVPDPQLGLAPDYIWIDYYKLDGAHYWLDVSSNGDVLYLKFGLSGTDKLREARSAQLPPEQVAPLFALLAEIDFFSINSRDPLREGVVYEGDALEVAAHFRGETRQVSAAPPEFVPPHLFNLITPMQEIIPLLPTLTGPQVFTRVGYVNPNRARARIRGGRPLLSSNNQELTAYPFMSKLINSPGRFVRVDPDEYQSFDGYFRQQRNPFISVSGNTFQVETYRLHRRAIE